MRSIQSESNGFPNSMKYMMPETKELAAVGTNAVEAFDHPHDVKVETDQSSITRWTKSLDTVLVSRSSRKSSVSVHESFVTTASSSIDNTLDSMPSFYDAPKKSPITEEDVVRIKAAVAKGRLRALENIKRQRLGAEPVDWKESDRSNNNNVEDIEKPNFLESGFDIEDDNFGIISKYSNPHQRFAPELVPATTAVVDGGSTMIITKTDVKYRKNVNRIRITKLKELFLESVKQSLEGEYNADTLQGWTHPSKAIDETDMIFAAAGININPDPTLSELTQFKTPARIGDRFPVEEACADDPFAMLYSGGLRKQKEEKKQGDEDVEDSAFRGPNPHIMTRFKVHDMFQNWLRNTYNTVRQSGRNWTARDVVRDVLYETQTLLNRDLELDEDAPLQKELVPKERNAGPCVVDTSHFAISFLVAWLERCEKNGW